MCRAGGRRCPSSKPSGAELDAKNKHRRELYAARKQQMEADKLKDKWGGKDAAVLAVPADATPEERETVLKTVKPENIYPGKKSEPADEQREMFLQYQQAADTISEFVNGKTRLSSADLMLMNEEHKEFREYTQDLPEGFTFIGGGVDKIAYKHEGTGLVYKVLGEGYYGDGGAENYDEYQKAYVKNEQMLIAEIDENLLRRERVRYAKNYFLTSTDQSRQIIAQEYLNPDEYKPYDIGREDRELASILRRNGYMDLHGGNVRMNKKNHEIVLFDCLMVGDMMNVEK